MASLFISYSRKNIDFARRLTERLKGQNLDFWIDWEGIEPIEDWWEAIKKGIEEADNFLFLISPDSVGSEVCLREVEHAIKNGKRLLPVVICDIRAKEAPSQLGSLNWIFLRENDDFEVGFEKLIRAVRTDLAWVQYHRRLQVKALEWQDKNFENSRLLRGKDLQEAEDVLAKNGGREPHITPDQQDYVHRSRQASDRQSRVTRTISTIGLVLLAVLAVFGFVQASRATVNAKASQENAARAEAASTLAFDNAATAQANAEEARRQADIATARELAASAVSQLQIDPELSLLLAIEADKVSRNPQTEEALRQSLLASRVRAVIQGHTDAVYDASYSPDGKYFVTASWDNTARIWDAGTNLPVGEVLRHEDKLERAVFSPVCPDGTSYVVTAGRDRTARIWNVPDGSMVEEFFHFVGVYGVAVSPDCRFIVTVGDPIGDQGTVFLWTWDANPQTEPTIQTAYTGHTGRVNTVEFSPDGRLLLTASDDETARVWEVDAGANMVDEAVHVLEVHTAPVYAASFSHTGQYIGAASQDKTVSLWALETDQVVLDQVFKGHTNWVFGVEFSPDDQFLISAGRDVNIGRECPEIIGLKCPLFNDSHVQ